MADDIILKGLKAYSVVEAEDKAMILQKYLDEILLFNPVLKLVGEKDREEIIYRHILDSASSYPVFSSLTKTETRLLTLEAVPVFPVLSWPFSFQTETSL